jgi:hypothetical protein
MMTKAASQSLLERMIARLTTQQAFLDHAALLVARLDGPVLEVGLGKGRTFDHLRHLFPARAILAFDRDLHAPASVAPVDENLILGEFSATLPRTADRIGQTAAFAHADFGSPDRDHDARQATWLGPMLQRLVRPGGVVVADRELNMDSWQPVPMAPQPWPYFMWRV